jgi:hypothetical protein
MVTSGLGRTKYTKFLWPSDKQGVEDFQNEFAKAHCAVEAKHFCPATRAKLISENAHAAARRSNKQLTTIRQSCGDCSN